MTEPRIAHETELTIAETAVLAQVVNGEDIGAVDREKGLRGDAVRFIIEEACRTNGGARIIAISGWTIDGDIDLKGRAGLGNLSFKGCDIRGSLILEFAELRALDLDGAVLDKLDAMRARIRGSVYMRWGFHARKGVDLSGAWIEGSLTCRGATFEHDPEAADAVTEETRDAAMKTADLSASRARFPNEMPARPGHALAGASAFEDPFCLNLRHATVGGTLYLGPKHKNECRPWRKGQKVKDRGGRTVLKGSVDLSGLRVREFVDEAQTYEYMRANGHRIMLDGFEYDRFGGCSPQDWRFRVREWLSLQPNTFPPEPDALAWLRGWGVIDREFHPQPYEQLARVLKVMGHDRDAKEVQFRRRRNQTLHNLTTGRILNGPRRVLGWLGVRLYGLVTGFGYKALNLLAAIAVVVFACSLLLSQASNVGLVAPAGLMAADSAWWRQCRAEATPSRGLLAQIVDGPTGLNACLKRVAPAPRDTRSQGHFEEHPAFHPFFYAIEAFFPVLDLGQKQFWLVSDRTPQGAGLGALLAFYTMLGWVGTSLLIAGLFARFNQRGGD